MKNQDVDVHLRTCDSARVLSEGGLGLDFMRSMTGDTRHDSTAEGWRHELAGLAERGCEWFLQSPEDISGFLLRRLVLAVAAYIVVTPVLFLAKLVLMLLWNSSLP